MPADTAACRSPAARATITGNCKASGFVCPFHGWRFNMHGENTFVYGKQLFSERQLDPDDINLIPCRVETAIGAAWINFDDDAPSVRDSIGPLIDRLEAHNADKLRMEWCYATVLPANWKLAMEAFMEGYHVMATHPQLHHALGSIYSDMYGAETGKDGTTKEKMTKSAVAGSATRDVIDAQFKHMELLSEGMAGMLHAKEVEIARGLVDAELPDDPNEAVPIWYGMIADQISKQLAAKGEPVPNLCEVNVSHPINAVEFLFPHYFLLPFFSSFSGYRIRPLGQKAATSRSTRSPCSPRVRSLSRSWSRSCCLTTAPSSRRFRGRIIRTYRSSRSDCTPRASSSCGCRKAWKG